MVFQGENVVLDKNVLRKKDVDFIPNEKEWSARNRQQKIIDTSRSSSGTNTILTVPINKTFFVTNIFLSVVNEVAASGNARCALSVRIPAIQNNDIANISIPGDLEGQDSVNISLSMPLLVRSGGTITMTALEALSTDCFFMASVIGWEEDKKLI